MRTIRVLILEDDLLTLSKIFETLYKLEDKLLQEKSTDISVMVLSEYVQVEKYINPDPKPNYDLVLLDRDCKIAGSFHVLDIEKIGVDKIIGISSVPEYNQNLQKLGVRAIVGKEYDKLDDFADRLNDVLASKLNEIVSAKY